MKSKTIPELDVLLTRAAADLRRRGINYAPAAVAQAGRHHARVRHLLAGTFAGSARRGYSGGTTQYKITRSLRLRSSASGYLTRTPGGAGNRQKFTQSFWIKRGALGQQAVFVAWNGASAYTAIEFSATDQLDVYSYDGAYSYRRLTNRLFRDPSAHLHIIVAVDTTANSVRVWINGVEETSWATNSGPTGGTYNTWVDHTVAHYWGRRGDGSLSFDGLISEIHHIDGTQITTPTTFGKFDPATGVWVPIAPTGITYGTTGYWLSFANNTSTTTLGYDDAGGAVGAGAGSNDWTTSGISVTAGVTNDSLVDTPTNYGTDTGAGGEVRGNYCVWNPLKNLGTGNLSLSEGNLKATFPNGGAAGCATSTIAMSSGKWYWQVIPGTADGVTQPKIGVVGAYLVTENVDYSGLSISVAYGRNGNKYINGVGPTAYGTAYTSVDVIGFALDMDAGTLVCYLNGTSQGTIATGLTGPLLAAMSSYNGCVSTVNFGQKPWVKWNGSAYVADTAPSGFKALCTQNLPDPAVKKPSSYFDVNTRTGTGAAFSVTGKGFQPDLAWTKGRSGATDHAIYDAVRGVQKDIGSNLATDETTQTQGVTAFNADGFSGGTLAKINTNTATYVDWLWKESPTSGVDIVSYTGNGANRTVSHALGAVPSLILVKSRATAGADTGWAVHHSGLANTEYLKLGTTAAKATDAAYWNSTTPTSSVFSLGTAADVNTNNDTYIAYLFAEVAGFSKFGSYTGNGSADGAFAWCGFRPRFVIIKRVDSTGSWYIEDTSRNGYNPAGLDLHTDQAAAEANDAPVLDFVANGIKQRNTYAGFNSSGATYVFIAFAENPFKYARAR
jgi:hypothetical protein